MLVCGYRLHKAVRVMPGCAFSFLSAVLSDVSKRFYVIEIMWEKTENS